MSDTEQTIKILAIESSCDETAAAVVVNGRDMRSNHRLLSIHYMEGLYRRSHRESILKRSIR